MKAINPRSGGCLASNVLVAGTALARMKGLLGKANLQGGDALWLKPCKSVHTIGMRFSIDFLFLDTNNLVIRVCENVPPNRFSPFEPKARSVMELPAGTVRLTSTIAGDRIEIS